jgi:hypothetical protein
MGAIRRRSRKRSAASSRLPERPTLFLDASQGGRIAAEALRARGATVVTHAELFAEATQDDVWLQEAGRQDWFVLSKDTRIRYRQNEIQALHRHHVGAFVLASGNLTGAEMAEAVTRALPRIYRIARRTPRPFVARVTRSGDAALI